MQENRNKVDKRLQCDCFNVGDWCLTPILMFGFNVYMTCLALA